MPRDGLAAHRWREWFEVLMSMSRAWVSLHAYRYAVRSGRPCHMSTCHMCRLHSAALFGMACGHKAYTSGYSDHCSGVVVV